MKRIITLIVSMLLVAIFALSACNGDTGDGKGKNGGYEYTDKYDYTGSTEKEFQFKTFVGVPSNMPIYNAAETSYYLKYLSDAEFDNYYKELADAGFTVADGPYTPEGKEHNLRMLDAAEKYGIKQFLGEMVSDSGISLSNLLRGKEKDINNKNYSDYTDAEIKTLLTEFFKPYIDHAAFYGFSFWDEPTAKDYDNITRAKRLFDEAVPGKILYVNLYPISASTETLGVNSKERIKYATDYIEKVNTHYISYDRYPLTVGTSGSKNVMEDFLYNMQIYRQAADLDGRELWTYLQTTAHRLGNTVFAKPDNIADFRWQTYSFLAFGGSSISWFTTFPPTPVDSHGTEFKTGLYDRKGRKTDIYYFVKAIQEEIHAFEKIYFNFEWQSLITVLGDDNEDGFTPSFDYLDEGFAATEHSRIESYSCQQDTLIGCFKDKNDFDGFIVTNYANPGLLKNSKTQIKFKDAEAVVIYRLTEKRIVKLNDSKTLDITLLPGEGVFLIPLKDAI